MAQKQDLRAGRRHRADANPELVEQWTTAAASFLAASDKAEADARRFALDALRLGVPADRLAERCGMTRSAFYRWVRGESRRRRAWSE